MSMLQLLLSKMLEISEKCEWCGQDADPRYKLYCSEDCKRHASYFPMKKKSKGNQKYITIPKEYCTSPFFSDYGGKGVINPKIISMMHLLISDAPQGSREIISVGSGNGAFEEYLRKYHHVPVVLIDPEEEAMGLKLVKKPDYRTLRDYMRDYMKKYPKKKYPKSNAPLLLVWPSPNTPAENKKNGYYYGSAEEEKGLEPYDIRAIKEHRPPVIILLIENAGASGSRPLHTWLKSQNEYDTIYYEVDARENVFVHPLQPMMCRVNNYTTQILAIKTLSKSVRDKLTGILSCQTPTVIKGDAKTKDS